MNILIDQFSGVPIYEQIETQLRAQILSQTLKGGEMLPSIRALAKDLSVGIITVKRAYDDLSHEGLLISVQGKGVFVADIAPEEASDIRKEQLREKIVEVKEFCDGASITKEELIKEIDNIWEVTE